MTSLVVVLGLGLAPSVARADELPTDLVATTTTMRAPASPSGLPVPVTITVTAADGTDVVGGPVTLERRVGGDWRSVTETVTDADGSVQVTVKLSRLKADNVFRARHAGGSTYAASSTGPKRLDLERRHSRLRLDAPKTVVDEQAVDFSILWRTRSGMPVAGRVLVQTRRNGRWRTVHKLRTNDKGRASWRYKVRSDSVWRARGKRLAWVSGDTSNRRRINNLPPGRPVVLPDAAPRPRVKLPAQPRATQRGAAVTIRRIPDPMWHQMVGRTWHSGCPVGRAGLRLIRVNYWAYDGYRRRGEIVVNARVSGNVAAAFREIYERRLPIRSMYRVDRFGWSAKLHGGNDYKSMAAGNTSAFNCRSVVNRPGVRSPHSYGTAVDVNTWENPYRSATGIVPNTWWQSHSNPRYAWRSRDHAMVRLMRRHGLFWTYGLGDTQHFDATAGSAQIRIAPPCVGNCH
ncbi:hypothetical protein ncot_04740 [Nocardioides sp. JQ2195]|uniref:M15 family metallopeptidase n=1 Tax=Nocardioides sp. JQ2195 TaxID=2592334 RepID=UPI00143E0FBD|nr:M15 family metallopeptidase [Nocardioides sp. JQ2195]QIX25985.1 hypothetical protein ncot_04740 [Nocardioides sp. JQ2195]